MEKVSEVSGSVVKPREGDKIDIKRVQPVDRDTGDVQPWLGGLSMHDSAKKDQLVDMMLALLNFLNDGEERSVESAALYLKEDLGDNYGDTLTPVGFGKHLAEAIRLFDSDFELTKRGYYVKRA